MDERNVWESPQHGDTVRSTHGTPRTREWLAVRDGQLVMWEKTPTRSYAYVCPPSMWWSMRLRWEVVERERTDEDVWTDPEEGDLVELENGDRVRVFSLPPLPEEEYLWVKSNGYKFALTRSEWAKLREGGRVVRRG